MKKIAFCDDEASVLFEIQKILNRYQTIDPEITYTAYQSPIELLADIEKGISYDVIFLDVLMPGENGIETAGEIRKYDTEVKIIFLTSSTEFAVQSYAVGAYYYQLKPISEDVFLQLLQSVLAKCKQEQEDSLILRCKNGITRIELHKLEYCEVIHRTIFFHLINKTVLESTGNLDELSRQLTCDGRFLRPHRSYLVNLEHVHSLSFRGITMSCMAQIPIPRGKYNEFKNKYLEYACNNRKVIL